MTMCFTQNMRISIIPMTSLLYSNIFSSFKFARKLSFLPRKMISNQGNETCRNFNTSISDILRSFPLDKQEAMVGNDISNAIKSLVKSDAVCFDVDSTVIQEEGIDVLAKSLGKYDIVSELTTQAMMGDVKFEDALKSRLDVLQPSRQVILSFLQNHQFKLSPGIDELIRVLQQRGKHVYFVSGGLRIMIEPVAKSLNIPLQNIYANTLFFHDDDNGSFKGHDSDEPTSADLGKARALSNILEKNPQYENIVMVGDGVTDAQAKPPATSFIGYGGIVERQTVKEKACWYIYNFNDLTHVLDKFDKL